MDDLHHREQTMQRDVFLVSAAGASLLNGMHFSPLFDPILFLLRPFISPLLASPLVMFYLTSIFISVMTLAIAGVPAALYERLRGQQDSTPMSLGIWLVATLLLAIPGILGATGYYTVD